MVDFKCDWQVDNRVKERAHHQDKRHEAAEDCEEDVAPFVAEAATRLKQDEGGNKECADGIQKGPVHWWQQPACCCLPGALHTAAPHITHLPESDVHHIG
jgi:hypothetical protein